MDFASPTSSRIDPGASLPPSLVHFRPFDRIQPSPSLHFGRTTIFLDYQSSLQGCAFGYDLAGNLRDALLSMDDAGDFIFDVTHGVQQATSAVSGKQEVQSVTIEAAADLAGFFPPHHTH